MTTTRAGLDQVLRPGGGRRYAAAAGQNGIEVVEYTQDRRGLTISAAVRHGPLASGEVDELVRALAEAIGSLGGRGGTLALGLSGFGTAHHILTLPVADSDVLEPVVRRELLRYYPDLDDPVIGFTVGPEVEAPEAPRRELLVGAVPRRLAERLHGGLASRGIELEHLTVLPRSVQGVYDAFDGGAAPAVAVLLLEGGPLLGCFHDGALRLFIEPPPDIHGRPLRSGRAVAEQVERATLFLRQQFPGPRGARVLVSAPEAEQAALDSALRDAAEAGVARLSDLPPGPLAALGAAIDARSATPLQLLPPRLRPRGWADVWTRRVAAAAVAVLTAAAVWWAGSAMVLSRAEAERARAAESRVEARLPWLLSAAETLESRRAHAERMVFLEQTVASRDAVVRILEAVASATASDVRLEAAHVVRADEGWSVLLAGVATGRSSGAAVRAVDALYRGLPERLPVTDVELGELEGVGDGDGPVAIAFDMSFIVRWDSDLRR